MSVVPNSGNGKITVPDLLQRKIQAAGPHSNFQKITCLTAYDYPTARLLDEGGVDVILVGDSLGMVVLGHESTLPVTIDEMLHHTRAVRRGMRRALLVADMPYGSYHTDMAESLHNAMRFVKEAGAEAVKVEGGERRLELISRLTEAEIPVMGHVGLTPQSVNALGGYRVQGKTADAAEQLIRDAHAVEAAGAFAVVLEAVPRELAAQITALVRTATGRFLSFTIFSVLRLARRRNLRANMRMLEKSFPRPCANTAMMCARADFLRTPSLIMRRNLGKIARVFSSTAKRPTNPKTRRGAGHDAPRNAHAV